jgi:hypothetical protein
MSRHVNATVVLSNITVTLYSSGRYEATPGFGFHTGPEERQAKRINGRVANMVFRPDGTYDIEFLDESP